MARGPGTAAIIEWSREVMADELQAGKGVSIPEMVGRVIRHFEDSEQPEVIDQARDELLRVVIYRVLQTIVRASRTPQAVEPTPDVDRATTTYLARVERWKTWMELVYRPKATPGRRRQGRNRDGLVQRMRDLRGEQMRLMDMSKDDLLRAAARRERQAEGMAWAATLFRRLAAQMGDESRVSDHWSAEEIEALASGLEPDSRRTA